MSCRPWPPAVTSLLARCTFAPAGAAVTCAVSGGADSLALVVLAVASGCEVTAVHVDHGLREGSWAEAHVVADTARRLGARFRAERVSIADGPNLEARARAARFSVLPPDVATGHTMDDQAETILCNLLRGAGPDGMSGMRPGHAHPLLGVRRLDTRAVCAAMGLQWFDDPSNQDPRHLRNRVRAELLPLCGALSGRDPVPVLARQADLCRDEAGLLDALAVSAVPDPSDAREVSSAPLPLARRAVRRWLRAATATAEPHGPRGRGQPHPPSSAEVARVLSVARGEVVATELEGGRRVRRSAGRLLTGPSAGSGKVTPVTTDQVPAVVPRWAETDVGALVLTSGQIAARVAELGAEITADYSDHPPLLVGVLKGAMVFMSDLFRTIELPVDVDFMAVSSYGSATHTSGVVRIVKDLDAELTGRHVLVVEDIIDSGLTLSYLRKYLQARQPASVEICALIVKEGRQRVGLDLRYKGFTIPSVFVVGYGLDVCERYRNLPDVHVYNGDPGTGR